MLVLFVCHDLLLFMIIQPPSIMCMCVLCQQLYLSAVFASSFFCHPDNGGDECDDDDFVFNCLLASIVVVSDDTVVVDVLQMMGRAGRPQFDESGVACIYVQDLKKHFYKKFLYEPFPVESKWVQIHCHCSTIIELNGVTYLTRVEYDILFFVTSTRMIWNYVAEFFSLV